MTFAINCARYSGSRRSFRHQVMATMMRTDKILELKTNSTEEVDRAAAFVASLLHRGLVAAVPTDTVYGLTAYAQDNQAVRTLYNIKGRDANKPIAICVAKVEDIYKWAKVNVPHSLLKELLPGPVTLVFERTSALNPSLNAHTNLVGIRVVDDIFISKVAASLNGPLALTSANVSNSRSSLCIEEFKDIWSKVHLVVDGGLLSDSEDSRLGSTVVDLSTPGHFRIIRSGISARRTCKILIRKYGLTVLTPE